jgi:hypothetical protein
MADITERLKELARHQEREPTRTNGVTYAIPNCRLWLLDYFAQHPSALVSMQDKRVIEIGNMYFGGIATIAKAAGAIAYLGIDIDLANVQHAIQESRELSPFATYAVDDPLFVLRSSKGDDNVSVITNGVYDTSVFKREYLDLLTAAIADVTHYQAPTLHASQDWTGIGVGPRFQLLRPLTKGKPDEHIRIFRRI